MHAYVTILLGSLVTTDPSTKQGAGADAYDGCSFISAAEVEAVSGEKLERKPRVVRRTQGTVEVYGCTYKSPNFNVEVRLEAGRSKDDLEMYMLGLKGTVKSATSSTLKPVKGLGDEAWWAPINETSGILHVIRKTDVVWVQTYGKGKGAGSLEKTKAITDKVYAQYLRVRK